MKTAYLFLLFWPIFTLLLGFMQGPLMLAIRRTPPGPEATGQSRALHLYGALAYLLPALLPPAGLPLWLWASTAAVARLTLFDVGINLSDGNPATGPFHVGQTALYDRTLRRLAPASPDRLNAWVKLAGLTCYAAALVALFLL